MMNLPARPESEVDFICSHCGAQLSVSATQAGLRGTCPACGNEVICAARKSSQDSQGLQAGAFASTESSSPEIENQHFKESQPIEVGQCPMEPERVEEFDELEPIHPKSGLTQTEEEMNEFSQIILVAVLILGSIVAIGVVYSG